MVVLSDQGGGPKRPSGYKVAPRNRVQLRAVADELRPMLVSEGCYKSDPYYLDASHLLENVLHRAQYTFHPDDSPELVETAAFAIPERKLIVIRADVYDKLSEGSAFSRYTVVHEFSHIVLDHAVTLHRGAVLGQHEWWEDSEWQANNLTAELLMPVAVVRALRGNSQLIQQRCGVSAPAAENRLKNLRNERLI
ncbi:ImmA/IrrE family metallo-endopeptidase [Burkholderia cenocepacia]|uniref:ImmA/IrrE family metallo-endopeptidase n=1 Tax=Burkholderia cenocepacia TaxID=95486 RepID=UPI001B90354A|nr:ImmA/IrrE family metallo-endopeptidase [Burkholderia cenocepacia]MBR8509642.1 ImmA/IrrE family metallo-endopeptidase [Burkholderia cenocepacia]